MEKKRRRVGNPQPNLLRLCLILFALGPLGGCGPSGPETYPVSGTVTFNGEDLPDGYVTFMPEDASQAPDAGKVTNGRFDFRATAGPKRVEVQASRFVGPENPVMGLRPQEQYIPERYNIESELTAEVTPDGPNEFKFELDDKGP